MENEAKKWRGSNTTIKTLKYVYFIYLQSVHKTMGTPESKMNRVEGKFLEEQ